MNVDIHEVAELDLFDDLDGLAALIAGLDLVISVDNINSNLAGAIGTPLWYLTQPFWFLLLGQSYNPFFPRARVFDLTKFTFNTVAETLAEQLENAISSGDAHGFFRSSMNLK